MMHTGARESNGTRKIKKGLVISPMGMAKIDLLRRINMTVKGSNSSSRSWQIISRFGGWLENFINLPTKPLPKAVHSNHNARMMPSINSLPVKNRTNSLNNTTWLIMAEKPMAMKIIWRCLSFIAVIILFFFKT